MAINENAVTDTLTPTTGTLGIVGTVNISSGGSKYQVGGVTTNALAWVQFAGSTGTIASSYNVSSVTRNGTGDYSVTMTNATSDINYSCIASTSASSATPSRQIIQVFTSNTGITVNAPTTTVFRLNTVNAPTGVNYDSNYVCTAIFGN